MFALCVVTTVSLVSLIWFRSFQKNLFVLLNPDEEIQEKFFAQIEEENDNASLFGLIGRGFSDGFANISSFFKKEKTSGEIKVNNPKSDEIYPLPLSGSK